MKSIEKQNRKGKVLILGHDTRSFLTVIRSLGRNNICVHVGWHKQNPAIYSKYITKFWDIPPYSLSNNSWKEALIKILEREQFDIVIPCHDCTIIPIQHNRSEFEKFGRIYILDDRAFTIANNKLKTNKLARNLGIPVPKGITVNKSTKCEEILSLFNFPVVLKPVSSYTVQNVEMRRNVKKVYNSKELTKDLRSIDSNDEIEVYENFIGRGVGIELLAFNGQVLYAFQHTRIHEPLEGGGSSYRKSVLLQSNLLDASRKLIAALDYTGVAMVEYKVNFLSGDWRFIEINPRFWGSLPLAVAAGADFPYFLYQMLTKGKRSFTDKYKTNIYCRALSDDIHWIVANFLADRKDATLSTRPLWRVAFELFNIISFRERSDTFVLDDPKPGFVEFRAFTIYAFQRAFSKLGAKLKSLNFFRIIYRHNMLNKLKDARTILFVCKGNICRSPFAQHYFQQACKTRLRVLSCGYYPKEGRFCPNEAITVARKLGVDLTKHRSVIIDDELVDKSDIIFCFDEENINTLIRRYRRGKSKIWQISSLDVNAPRTIEDPYGKGVDSYYQAFRDIMRILNTLNEMDPN